MDKKRKNASQPTKSIAVQIFKGKRKEDSSDEDTEETATKTENKGRESLSKVGKKRKSETLPASEESLLVKSAKKKSLPVAKTARVPRTSRKSLKVARVETRSTKNRNVQ